MLWSHGVTLLKGYNWASILQYSILGCITWLLPLGPNYYHRWSLHLPPLLIHSTNQDPYHRVVLFDIATRVHFLYLFNVRTRWIHPRPCIGYPEKYLNCLVFPFLQNNLLSFLGVCNQDIYAIYGMVLIINTSTWGGFISLHCIHAQRINVAESYIEGWFFFLACLRTLWNVHKQLNNRWIWIQTKWLYFKCINN